MLLTLQPLTDDDISGLIARALTDERGLADTVEGDDLVVFLGEGQDRRGRGR